jgi:hypothetical protein
MKTCVFTPLHETGISVAHIVPYARSHNTRLGRESSWLKVSSGTHFLRPLMVKGELFAPDRWSGFFVSWEMQTAFSTG